MLKKFDLLLVSIGQIFRQLEQVVQFTYSLRTVYVHTKEGKTRYYTVNQNNQSPFSKINVVQKL